MSIRGDTTAGANMAHAVGMHIPSDNAATPSGSDTKSTAIAAVVNKIHDSVHDQTTTANSSLDQLRQGLAAACQRVDATDQQGAAGVNNSGTVTI